ncbi:PTS transporter subunit EIIC [Clostridium sp. AM58-1XD]|uniref:PTS transporter subunit EIIC n=1 Tax=Clostridium sp. AM58-1XD TaxID=2292307 RepID=UPI00241CCDF1|nr:PTS transporter subunit EIIC [Clostridium sp. AM58-1XD]
MIINGIGAAISKAGVFGPFLFGAGERALLPFGLHHILVAMIRFTEAGGTQVVDGQTISGALNIFYAELKAGTAISPAATAFLSQGKMPTFIFGLPAAAAAMYHCARTENKNAVKGLFISGVIASAVTGITEPIEFLFLFVSPMLYVFHAIMTGLGFMVMALLNVTIGNTDGGILDFLIFGVLQGTKTRWYLVIIVGIIWAFIYYNVFKYVIMKKNLMTPGRAVLQNQAVQGEFDQKKSKKTQYDTAAILAALGGKENIDSLDNCVTRLRMVVKDANSIDADKLAALGALGVMKLDEHNVQVIIGTKVAAVKGALDELME